MKFLMLRLRLISHQFQDLHPHFSEQEKTLTCTGHRKAAADPQPTLWPTCSQKTWPRALPPQAGRRSRESGFPRLRKLMGTTCLRGRWEGPFELRGKGLCANIDTVKVRTRSSSSRLKVTHPSTRRRPEPCERVTASTSECSYTSRRRPGTGGAIYSPGPAPARTCAAGYRLKQVFVYVNRPKHRKGPVTTRCRRHV